MEVTVKFMVEEISKFNQQIDELTFQRTQFISTYKKVILKSVCSMMDWSEDKIARYNIKYSYVEKMIMVEVFLKSEVYARYVFEINKSAQLSLRFREELLL